MAAALGLIILISLVLMPTGLLFYQRLSNQEKELQARWPVIASKLESFYEQIDRFVEPAQKEANSPSHIAANWQTQRENFRLIRRWDKQIAAAQEIENTLAQGPADSMSASEVTDAIRKLARQAGVLPQLDQARNEAQTAMDQFVCDYLIPYRDARNSFPGNWIVQVMKLPETPVFVFTTWSTSPDTDTPVVQPKEPAE